MIVGKVGRLGHGKTMRGVVDAIALCKLRGGLEDPPRCWLAGNIAIDPPPGMVFHQLPMSAEFSPTLSALMKDARASKVGLVVFVDEVDEVWGSADWPLMTKGDRHRIKQSRHYGCDIVLTAQYVDQIEKSLRNIMEEVELVRAVPSPTIERFERGKRPWFILGQRFRPAAVRELATNLDKDKRLGRTFHLYRRAHEALYDTAEIVEPVNAEALCATHKRALAEERCPRCHPEKIDPAALAVLAVMAEDSNGTDRTEAAR